MNHLEPKIDLVQGFRKIVNSLVFNYGEVSFNNSTRIEVFESWLEDLQMWVPTYDPTDEV